MRNLYARHAEEFSESMTALIDVQTAGGVQKVRVFSLHGRGLNLWRQRKPSLRERVQALLARMQPDMFISAR